MRFKNYNKIANKSKNSMKKHKKEMINKSKVYKKI